MVWANSQRGNNKMQGKRNQRKSQEQIKGERTRQQRRERNIVRKCNIWEAIGKKKGSNQCRRGSKWEKKPKQHPTKEKQAGKNNHTSVSFVLHIHFFKQHCLSQSGFWISHFQQNIHILSRDAPNVILLDYCIFFACFLTFLSWRISIFAHNKTLTV